MPGTSKISSVQKETVLDPDKTVLNYNSTLTCHLTHMLYISLEGNTLSPTYGLNLKTSPPKTAGPSSETEVMSFP